MDVRADYDLQVEALACLISNQTDANQKRAANLILRTVFPQKIINWMFEAGGGYPVSRNDFRVAKWRKAVLKKGKCELCGSTDHLEAHHVLEWSTYPPGRIDINNGMCLCHKCHTEEHKYDNVYALMKSR